MSKLSSSVPLLVVTKTQVLILWNYFGILSLKGLLQIAENVKIIENRQNANSTQFVMRFQNFISDV